MEDVKTDQLTPNDLEMLNIMRTAAVLAKHAIETHSLNCRCFICWEFMSASNSSSGFVRAVFAIRKLIEENAKTKAVQ